MATQSFLKNLDLRSRKKISRLVSALEMSEKNSDKTVTMQKSVSELKGEQAKETAKKIKWSL